MLSRREMLKRSAAGAGAVAVTRIVPLAGVGALTAALTACPGAPKVSTWVRTIVGALEELKPLLPGAAGFIATAIKIADDFNAAFQAGKFADSVTLFKNLTEVVGQIIADVGVNNPTVKSILAVVGIAIRTIAVLLDSQSNQPVVRAKMANAPVEQLQAVVVVKKLASPAAVDAIFAASKPQ